MKSKKIQYPKNRSFEQIKKHYEVEKAIAERLKKSYQRRKKNNI